MYAAIKIDKTKPAATRIRDPTILRVGGLGAIVDAVFLDAKWEEMEKVRDPGKVLVFQSVLVGGKQAA
jgi:hypothetical protein